MGRFILIVLLALCGCDNAAEKQTKAGDFTVETLFTHEGCTVYRFTDGGRNIYYAHCTTGSSQTSWRQRAGKTTRYVTVSTGVP